MPTKWWRTLVRCLPLCVRVVVYVLYVHTMWCMCALCVCGHMQSCAIIPMIELWGWPCRKGWEVCVCISFHCHMQCSWPFRKLQEQMLRRLAFKTGKTQLSLFYTDSCDLEKGSLAPNLKCTWKTWLRLFDLHAVTKISLNIWEMPTWRFLYREETNEIFPSNPHSITESIACIGTSVYYI